MKSKLILFFGAIAVSVSMYIGYAEVTVEHPSFATPGSLVSVTSSRAGSWLIEQEHIVLDKTLIFIMPDEDVEIIFNMQKYVIMVPTELDQFTTLIRNWAPQVHRLTVAKIFEDIALGYKPAADAVDPVANFIELTRLNNRIYIDSDWKIFFQNLGFYCSENMSSATLEEHRTLWIKIAEALRCKDEVS